MHIYFISLSPLSMFIRKTVRDVLMSSVVFLCDFTFTARSTLIGRLHVALHSLLFFGRRLRQAVTAVIRYCQMVFLLVPPECSDYLVHIHFNINIHTLRICIYCNKNRVYLKRVYLWKYHY